MQGLRLYFSVGRVVIFSVAVLILYGVSSCNVSEGERLLFLGDSHIQRWDLDYYFPYSDNDNQGISGETIDGLSAKLSNVNFSQFDLVVIQIGFNDGARLLETPLELQAGIEEMKQSISSLISVITEADIKIILTSVIPHSANYKELDFSCSFLQDYNQHLLSLSTLYRNVYYGDIAVALTNNDNCIDAELLIDEVHLNRYGYSRVSKALIQIL